MKLNNIVKYGLILGLPALSMVSCVSSGDNPGIEYAPNMYVSQGYEPFSQEVDKVTYNPNNMTMRLPVNGTVARGQASFIYPHPNTGAGYEASIGYTPWVAPTKANVEEGQRLYNIYCWHCHGKKGKNDGPIFKDKKMPAPAWKGYQSDYIKQLAEGKAYHTIVHGKGLMGSHSFMLDPEERWKVIHFVKALAYGDSFEYAKEVSPSEIDQMMNTNATNDDMNQNSAPTFPGTPEEKAMIMTAMSKVEFKAFPNRKVMMATSEKQLDKVAAYLKGHPTYLANIIGHTGATLTEDGAATLGMDRANSVREYLIKKGVNSSNITAKSVADSGMEGDITSSTDRQANRRVEIEIYK